MNAAIFKERVNSACEEKERAMGRSITRPEFVEIALQTFIEAKKRRKRRGYMPPPPPPVGPPGWFEWFAAEFARVGEDDPAHGVLLAAHSCRAFHMLPASWRVRAFAECQAAPVHAAAP